MTAKAFIAPITADSYLERIREGFAFIPSDTT